MRGALLAAERRRQFRKHRSEPTFVCDTGSRAFAESIDQNGGTPRKYTVGTVRHKTSTDNWSLMGDVNSCPSAAFLFKIFNCDMFNVLFSLAKDNVATAVPISSPGSSNRDTLISTVYKQHRSRQRLLEPYRRLKNALKKMQEEYLESKEHNVFMRYSHMQHMIHEVTLLEKQYWQLIDIPVQDVSETPNAYVQRVMDLLDEKTTNQPVKVGGIASLLGTTVSIAEKTKDQNLFETVRGKPTEELRKECDRLYIELYKLIRKYQGLRDVVHELTESFQDTRFYPIVPRYPILKTMIKRVLRAPAYAEICHEANE